MHHIVYHIVHHTHCNTLITYIVNTRKKSSCAGVTIVWLDGVGTATSGCAIELVQLSVIGTGCMENLHQLKNMKMNKNEGT
jgi:hypothetical protein